MENNSSKKFYESGWFMALCFGSVVLIPLGIFLVWRDKSVNKSLKIASSLISGVAFVSLFYCVVHNSISKPQISDSSTQEIFGDIKESSLEEYYSLGSEESKAKLYKPPIEELSSEHILKNEEVVAEEKSDKEPDKQTTQAENTDKNSNENKAVVHTESNQTKKDTNDTTPLENKESKDTKKSSIAETKKTDTKSNIVYVTPKGKKYHVKNPCGKGKFSAISIDEAISKGYTPCKKCVK